MVNGFLLTLCIALFYGVLTLGPVPLYGFSSFSDAKKRGEEFNMILYLENRSILYVDFKKIIYIILNVVKMGLGKKRETLKNLSLSLKIVESVRKRSRLFLN